MKKRALLFVGANTMGEILSYALLYNRGLFIEPIPEIYEHLKSNLNRFNKIYGTNFEPNNSLITSEDGKTYKFNLFNNFGASSSIYEPNEENWKWKDVKKCGEITLISKRIDSLLNSLEWKETDFDAVIDVQGAELEVLKGMGKYLPMIDSLKIEYSTVEYYKGGVIFDELDNFLVSNGFKIDGKLPSETHFDVIYKKSK